MKLSLNWAKEYVSIPDDIQAFCDRLDLTGTGVEDVEVLGESLEGVVVGHVLECEPHPDSDHMHVVKVDVGGEEPLQIVCGAPNIAAGIKVPVAQVGSVLPGDFKIKKSKLRGVASCGMCCSQRELGYGQDHEGIWVLPEDAPVGVQISDYLDEKDVVLDLEITPNRPDCLSVVGLAREIGAMYSCDWNDPLEGDASKLSEHTSGADVAEDVSIQIVDDERCPRYTARVIDGVKIGPSPDWLAERLIAEGARPINNVVDVTNYILFLYGQPLHAFDARALEEDGKMRIIVRPARDGEEFTTLDGIERTLTSDMTVIATPSRAVALAGVMGGLDSEVEDDTTCVLLEAATFSRAHTSRTSRNLGLISEASLRYERGVDAAPIPDISAAAAALIAEVSGGHVRPGIVDLYPVRTEAPVLEFRTERFRSMMGAPIEGDFIEDSLRRLGCEVSTTEEAGVLRVIPPTFRPDLEREIDLYEEVLRLWGMDRVEATLPRSAKRVGSRTQDELISQIVNNTLRASGLNETMTYSFADPSDISAMSMDEMDLGDAVEIINPLNSEASLMRQTILPGLLRSVAFNQRHGTSNIQLYEIGKVFSGREGHKTPKERVKVAGVMAGAMQDASWNTSPAPFDFFDGKGAIENLIRELAIPKARFKAMDAKDAPQLQPGRAAEVLSGGTVIGWVGEIHPLVAKKFDVRPPVVAFELDMSALQKSSRPSRDFVDIPEYPAVEIDQAFVVDDGVSAEKLMQVMQSAGGKLLDEVRVFDIFRDEDKLGSGKKSLAFNLKYRSPDRTLTAQEAEKAHSKLVSKVMGATGAEVRS